MKRTSLAAGVAFMIASISPSTAFASDPTPLAGIVLVAGAAALALSAVLAALHRFLAIGLLILGTIPLAHGVMLSFTYIATPARLGSYVFLAAALLYAAATTWRFNKDYWSKH
jgi:hypothetical protein